MLPAQPGPGVRAQEVPVLWEADGVQVSGAVSDPSFACHTLYLLLLKQPILGRQRFTIQYSVVSKFPNVSKASIPVIFLNNIKKNMMIRLM